jgi:hypothetical protein
MAVTVMTAVKQLGGPRFRVDSDRSLEQGKRWTNSVAGDHDFVSR